MRCDGGECLSQRLAQPAVKHEIELVMEKLRQVRTDRGCEHANTLEDGLFRRRILLAARKGELDVCKERRNTHPRICNPCLIWSMIDSRNGFISLPMALATCPMAMKARVTSVSQRREALH